MIRRTLCLSCSTVVRNLVLISFVHCATFAQERPSGQLKDTSEHTIRLIDPGISLGKPAFLLPPSLDVVPDDLLGLSHNILMGPTPFLPLSTPQKIDLVSPFKLQRAKEEELRTLRTILGSVQLGGVAYLAYRHIKKYGFK